MNLLTDHFIPVLTTTGHAMVCLPDLLDPCVIRTDYPRPVMNSAIRVLAISAANAIAPLEKDENWRDRLSQGVKTITDRYDPYLNAFEFGMDRPSFLTEFADIRKAAKDRKQPVERLIFDAPKATTLLHNKNIFFEEGRYPVMTISDFIPVLFDAQFQAFGAGAGYRTAMAGQGVPVVTIEPGEGFAASILANIMPGTPVDPESFPWLRPTDRSGNPVTPSDEGRKTGEFWFPQPKCISPVFDETGNINGYYEVNQGNNYQGWTPSFAPQVYNRTRKTWRGSPLTPGPRGYRNWLGISLTTPKEDDFRIPEVVRSFRERDNRTEISIIVEGWALESSKMKEYISSRQPGMVLNRQENDFLVGLILAAEIWQRALQMAFKNTFYYRYNKKPRFNTSPVRFEQLESDFYTETEQHFRAAVALVQKKDFTQAAVLFRNEVRKTTLSLFDTEFMSALGNQDMAINEAVVRQRNFLLGSLNGNSRNGKVAYDHIELEPTGKQEKTVKQDAAA